MATKSSKQYSAQLRIFQALGRCFMKIHHTSNDDDIIFADVPMRKKVLALLLIIVFVGALGIYFLQIHLQTILNRGDVSNALRYLKRISISIFLPMLPLCLFLLHLSRKTFLTQQYPPPGSKVLRDTKISRGKDAILRAKILAALAILLAISSIAALSMLFRLLNSFLS